MKDNFSRPMPLEQFLNNTIRGIKMYTTKQKSKLETKREKSLKAEMPFEEFLARIVRVKPIKK